MRRAFAIDVLACLRGGEQLRVIATVEDPDRPEERFLFAPPSDYRVESHSRPLRQAM